MSTVYTILQLVGVISALIIIHELGHFLAARLFKIEVEEFGVGFPPRALTLFEARGTKYSINWLPLGGFVRIKGEGDLSAADGLMAASPWKRLVVYAAGPAMNLIVGVLLYAVMFSQIGMPDVTRVRVIEVAPGSPSELAGLQVGDIILQIGELEIDSMNSLHNEIYEHLDETISMAYQRGDVSGEVSLTPRSDPPDGEGAIGIIMGNPTQPINWISALPMAARATYDHAVALVTLPAQVIKGSIAPEQARVVGYKGMYDVYQQVRDREPIPGAPPSLNVLGFFTTITVSLGILNLMPIPALDGGRILFTLPEIVLRRRIPVDLQNLINMISFAAIIILFLYINLLDFTNPIQLP